MRYCPKHGKVIAVAHWIENKAGGIPFTVARGHWGRWLCPHCGTYARASKPAAEPRGYDAYEEGHPNS